MSDSTLTHRQLHLPDLSIKGLLGIRDLTISRLGRVTLIAGKNGTGKTTILDAIRVYSSRGKYSELANILERREEYSETVNDDDKKIVVPDLNSLFYGRLPELNHTVSIGPSETEAKLTIELDLPNENDIAKWGGFMSRHTVAEESANMLRIHLGDHEQNLPAFHFGNRRVFGWSTIEENLSAPEIRCESIGPNLIDNDAIVRYWDNIALTIQERQVTHTLSLIVKRQVERIAMIGYSTSSRSTIRRKAAVKIKGESNPVPLRSLGDGAARMFSAALTLANSHDGFLLIDEAENGIHHSIQRDFWTMVLKTAQANNVQVLATTHSWDCVAGFAQAAEDVEDVDVALVRLEKDGDDVYAVEYSERNLKAAARSGIEVR